MRDSKVRTAYTSKSIFSFSAYKGNNSKYEAANINLGNNPISLLEIASCLNIFNYGIYSLWYSRAACTTKYNPKVYFGTVQSLAYNWIFDNNLGLKNGLGNLPDGLQKSGSWR